MSKNSPSPLPESEEHLVALLATLKVERVEEADFESRFLAEFHERVAREAVCCPARRHLFAHIIQMLDNFGRGRIAVGASVMGLGLVAVTFALYPAEPSIVETAASVAVEKPITPLLMPALANDLEACTSIQVEPAAHASFEVGGVMVTRGQHSTVIEVPNNYVPVFRHTTPHRHQAVPALPASSVRYAF